jgi:membrane peptidoglycan carboxypeptidase
MTSTTPQPWSRFRSIAGRAVLVTVSVILAAGIAGMIYLASLPGVGDAERRAARTMAAHGEPAGMPAPSRVVAAAISVEDELFYDNVAINVLSGMGRAALAALRGGGDAGGSTIDQQLAKQIYGGSTPRDIGLGVKLAVTYSPRQIMAMYLNVAYYGHGFWGIAQAAAGYFGTTPGHLTWGQAAMLGGLLQAPSAYDPLQHPALARARERHVLAQLVVNHYLTPRQATVALATPVRASR